MALPTTTKVPDTDLSGRILDTMFGTGWENIITGQENSIASGMVFPIMEGFNTVALTGVSLLFVWILCIGVMGTAHEGKALGKRYSTLWTPIRGALSVSMLAPVVKGMSLFQVALLVLVGWSINFANFVWDAGITAFVSQGGMLVASPPPQLQENANKLAESILLNQVTQAYFAYWEDKNIENGNVYEIAPDEDENNNEYIFAFNGPAEAGITEAMGKIIQPCPPDSICTERKNAIRQLISDIMPIADAIADSERSADVNDFVRAVDEYGNRVMTAMREHVEQTDDLAAELEQFKSQAVSAGWATAGSYYFSIAKINDRRRNAIQASAMAIDPNLDVISAHATQDFDRIMAGYHGYIRKSQQRNSTSAISETAQVADDSYVLGLLRKIFSFVFAENIFAGITTGLTENDPVATIIDYGHTLISGTVTGFVTYFAAAGTVGTAKGWSDSLVGQVAGIATAGTKSAFLGAAESVFKAASPMIIIMLIALFVFAFTIAYYLPALPMILWISGLVGWVILVLESLVAAPLWVAAHALPEGEGLAGQHGRQGYFLFLNVLIRPALMVTGLLFSMVLMAAIGKLIGLSMTILGISLAGRYTFGLISTIAMSVILCSLILIVAHKVYGLIAHFPATIMRWVGQQFHNLGEDQDEARVQRDFGAVGSRSENAVSRGTEAAFGDRSADRSKTKRSKTNIRDMSYM